MSSKGKLHLTHRRTTFVAHLLQIVKEAVPFKAVIPQFVSLREWIFKIYRRKFHETDARVLASASSTSKKETRETKEVLVVLPISRENQVLYELLHT